MKSLIFIACASLLTGCSEKPATDVENTFAPFVFSPEQASNAWSQVTAFVDECTPRNSGTPGSENAAAWLHKRLIGQGIDTTIDRFTDSTPRGPKPFFNVLASIPGKSDKWILLLSHFDTMSGISGSFQGANDSGSSTGLLLELATALHASAPCKYNVLCAFLDGEECMLAYSDRDGFHGSRRLANTMKQQGRKIKAVILMDMIGDRDLKITIPRNSTAALRVLALQAAEATGNRDKIGLFDGMIYDDHQAFLDLGYPAINLIDFQYGSHPGKNDYWHTTKDSIDKLSVDSLLVTGRIVMEMLNGL
ncbi:MAG: M28 family metallopeptidase [Kiritimatiellae bacterium]|nr:M28 family metallopeptidase [Kiritimatiellia bacterium]